MLPADRGHSLRRGAIALLLTGAVLGATAPAGRATPAHVQPGALTLGLTLSHLMDQLMQAIDAARNAGLTLEMEAGRQAYLTVQQAQNAYRESLNLTMDRVDNSTKTAINQLQIATDQVSSHTVSSLSTFGQQLQTTVSLLPFHDKEPKVSAVTPRWVVPSLQPEQTVRVRLTGSFEFAAQRGLTPSLSAGGKTYQPATNDNSSLQFELPASAFAAADPNKFGSLRARVVIPWEKCRLACLGHQRLQDEYQILLGALPESPGQISLVQFIPRTRMVTAAKSSSDLYESAASDNGNNDHLGVPHQIVADPGCTFVPGTRAYAEWSSVGDHSWSWGPEDAAHINWFTSVVHHGFSGTSGQMHFRVTAQQACPQSYTDTVTTVINSAAATSIRWGDRKAFPSQPGTWRLSFKAFDGSATDFTSQDLAHRFLRISELGGAIAVGTVDPASLQWP
jgi:hypothetical protein